MNIEFVKHIYRLFVDSLACVVSAYDPFLNRMKIEKIKNRNIERKQYKMEKNHSARRQL